ncbi:MAG TPA: NADPH-dependent FMN reductase [Acidimicrobiales bacterium]
MQLLTVCGSLQLRSSNRAALDVVSEVAAAAGTTLDDFDRLAEIPPFDPGRVDDPIDVIDDWRRRTHAADAIVVAAPEYAGALAGVVKNAFDWLVTSGELYRKPVAVVSAGTTGGEHARRMLAQTLTWQGAYVVAELGIASPRTKSDEHGRFTDPATVAALSTLTWAALDAPLLPADELVRRATTVVDSLGIDVVHVAPAS